MNEMEWIIREKKEEDWMETDLRGEGIPTIAGRGLVFYSPFNLREYVRRSL